VGGAFISGRVAQIIMDGMDVSSADEDTKLDFSARSCYIRARMLYRFAGGREDVRNILEKSGGRNEHRNKDRDHHL